MFSSHGKFFPILALSGLALACQGTLNNKPDGDADDTASDGASDLRQDDAGQPSDLTDPQTDVDAADLAPVDPAADDAPPPQDLPDLPGDFDLIDPPPPDLVFDRPPDPVDIFPDRLDSRDDSGCQVGVTGDGCTDSDQCGCIPSVNPECLSNISGVIAFPGGYCSARCTSPLECGENANCAQVATGVQYCLKLCSDVLECRLFEGYQCTTIPMSADPRTYCLYGGGSDSSDSTFGFNPARIKALYSGLGNK